MFERKFENCSADLADRIIKQSYKIEQKKSLYSIISAMFSELWLPQPVYIVPVIFALGLFLNMAFYPVVDVNEFVDNIYINI